MEKAIYAGSFDPFTIGHLDILKQASLIFSEIHVLLAHNNNKKRMFSENEMARLIEEVLQREKLSNCKVVIWDGLLAKYSEKHKIKFLIRGLRNNIDYNYEENMALVNSEINPNLNSIFFRAKKTFISSSFVRELLLYEENITNYVPIEVKNYIYKK